MQVALSFMLLVGAGLFLRSLHNLMRGGSRVQDGAAADVRLRSRRQRVRQPHGRTCFLRDLDRRLGRLPGVEAAGYSFMPLLGGGAWGMGFTVEGYQPTPGAGAGALLQRREPRLLHA